MARYKFNDNLHSQLAQAGPVSQRKIDADPQREPARAMGPVALQELESQAALTDFTMGGTVRGVAWSLNPYLGCLHGCRYCYVPDTMHLERNRWGTYVVAKHNLPNLLRRELREKKRKTVFISTSTDPYQGPEREHQITRRCLALLAARDWPVEVLTRSPLVLRDLDLLVRLTRIRVGMSVPTLDDEARRIIEPSAPAIKARLRTLRRLSDRGLPVFANYSPAYPPTNGHTMRDVAHAFQDAGVQWVNTSFWRRVPSFLAPLWDEVHRSEWRELAQHIADPKKQEVTRQQLSDALKAVGIPLHTGFFNPPFEDTRPYHLTRQVALTESPERDAITPPGWAPWVPTDSLAAILRT